jgi:hypothetical protein
MKSWQLKGWMAFLLGLTGLIGPRDAVAAPAVALFEDTFNRGIPGWSAVQPTGNYLDGPMRWQYDIVSGAFLEQSNIYTDAASASPSATAVMLMNDTTAGTNYTYRARLTAGDDDAFGLIFGYRDANNFYRVTFTRQRRTDAGYPWNGWNVDRKVANVATNLFGNGTPDHVESFFNTQYQPFDVTLSVTGNNLFSLTVLDDPEGARTEYKLVESQPLPAAANGKVGLVTWGMSGTALRGFRIANPVLEPIGLAGNPNALTNWLPVVTQRSDGSGLDPGSGNGGVPIWSLALGQNGAFGTLHENSDAFGGNTADGTVDFSTGALVTGDPGWSNIVVTARILPTDDDGHGLLLRYTDERNFYRISLRSQSSATGPAKGLSVQKMVDGVAEEVFVETAPQYDPVANIPYDLTAAMIGDRLQLQLVADPTGVATTYSYGPFDLAGARLSTGKVGLFSWGMARTEFDFIRVYGIDGVPLLVSSAFGQPAPAVGLQGFAPGSSVTASVPSPVEEFPGLRRVALGWTGQGSVPVSGTGSEVTFVLNQISSISWNWRTEVRLTVSAGPGGRVTSPTGDWLAEGTAATVTAVPDPGYVFGGWSGDLSGADAVLNLTLSRPLTLAARFEVDSDADGLPDAWEQANLGGLGSGPSDDPDADGRNHLEEYRRGTDPGFREVVTVSDGLNARWENVQRDPALPGQLVVRDFGSGFRGVWENSNDFREAVDARFIGAENVVPGVSFEGPRLVIRTNVWNPAWTNFQAQTVFSVGDNDGNCVYFRYRDEDNWYRVTVCGENNNLDWRAPFGVTIQKRVNGVFSEIVEDASIATDPSDTSFYKRVRVVVRAQGSDFEVRVAGWNAAATPPSWETASELVLPFSDPDHATGRFGVGTWGQSGGGPATASNPVNAGVLIEDVTVDVGGSEVFREDWELVPLAAELPAGWTNPSTGAAAGTWQVTAHGSILQTSNYSTPATGSVAQPRADGEGTIVLAPPLAGGNFLLELGFHPFDDDGIGFVFDFESTNDFSRVAFVSEATANGRIPQGVNISRKSAGIWTDLLVGDSAFVYRNGRPFAVELAHRNGNYRMTVRDLDDPAVVRTWSWTGPAATPGRQFGLTCWGETDAHFLYARAYALPAGQAAGALKVSRTSVEGGSLVLEIERPEGTVYAVERSEGGAAGPWSVVATNQTATRWTTTISSVPGASFYRLVAAP